MKGDKRNNRAAQKVSSASPDSRDVRRRQAKVRNDKSEEHSKTKNHGDVRGNSLINTSRVVGESGSHQDGTSDLNVSSSSHDLGERRGRKFEKFNKRNRSIRPEDVKNSLDEKQAEIDALREKLEEKRAEELEEIKAENAEKIYPAVNEYELLALNDRSIMKQHDYYRRISGLSDFSSHYGHEEEKFISRRIQKFFERSEYLAQIVEQNSVFELKGFTRTIHNYRPYEFLNYIYFMRYVLTLLFVLYFLQVVSGVGLRLIIFPVLLSYCLYSLYWGLVTADIGRFKNPKFGFLWSIHKKDFMDRYVTLLLLSLPILLASVVIRSWIINLVCWDIFFLYFALIPSFLGFHLVAVFIAVLESKKIENTQDERPVPMRNVKIHLPDPRIYDVRFVTISRASIGDKIVQISLELLANLTCATNFSILDQFDVILNKMSLSLKGTGFINLSRNDAFNKDTIVDKTLEVASILAKDRLRRSALDLVRAL